MTGKSMRDPARKRDACQRVWQASSILAGRDANGGLDAAGAALDRSALDLAAPGAGLGAA
jgi:hypothetical protein